MGDAKEIHGSRVVKQTSLLLQGRVLFCVFFFFYLTSISFFIHRYCTGCLWCGGDWSFLPSCCLEVRRGIKAACCLTRVGDPEPYCWRESRLQQASKIQTWLCPSLSWNFVLLPHHCADCFNQVLNVCGIGQRACFIVYSFICWTFIMK